MNTSRLSFSSRVSSLRCLENLAVGLETLIPVPRTLHPKEKKRILVSDVLWVANTASEKGWDGGGFRLRSASNLPPHSNNSLCNR